MKRDWDSVEIEAALDGYFRLLTAELAEAPLTKAAENSRVRETVQRSKGAVEFKLQNVSAVLRDLHVYWVRGYKPRGHYQHALRDAVVRRLEADSALEQLMLDRVSQPLPDLHAADIRWNQVSPPQLPPSPLAGAHVRRAVKRDYVALESQRRDLGLAGEKAVVNLEIERLERAGQKRLAKNVRHVALLDGDGLGYDVLSFTPGGEKKYIEVKTTRQSLDWPFLITRNEVDFSAESPSAFHLYRVFDFEPDKQDLVNAGLYTLPGPVAESCNLREMLFEGLPK